MNLAALGCVDYVIIDDNETPIANLKFIQPDFFAKGYEYSAEGIHPKTREEMAVIESYGGELRVPGHFFDHPLRIRRCRRRRKNGALVCLDARLKLTGLLFRQTLRRNTIACPTTEQFVQLRKIILVLRNHELAAAIQRYPFSLAIGRHRLVAGSR